MKEYFDFFLLAVATIFPMINPFGVMPVFLKYSENCSAKEARDLALKASLTALIAMVFFAISGQVIFRFFSISLDALRVVGGILFLFMGYDMLQAKVPRTKTDSETVEEFHSDVAITPLGIPLLCGPGTITGVILLNQQAQLNGAPFIALFYLGLLSVIAVVFLSLLASNRVMGVLGDSGSKVLLRIMGLILMVIAVEFFFTGVRSLLYLS